MRSTTTGTGPFQPAIRFDNRYFVHHSKFDDEDKANEIADKLVAKCLYLMLHQMELNGYIEEQR